MLGRGSSSLGTCQPLSTVLYRTGWGHAGACAGSADGESEQHCLQCHAVDGPGSTVVEAHTTKLSQHLSTVWTTCGSLCSHCPSCQAWSTMQDSRKDRALSTACGCAGGCKHLSTAEDGHCAAGAAVQYVAAAHVEALDCALLGYRMRPCTDVLLMHILLEYRITAQAQVCIIRASPSELAGACTMVPDRKMFVRGIHPKRPVVQHHQSRGAQIGRRSPS